MFGSNTAILLQSLSAASPNKEIGGILLKDIINTINDMGILIKDIIIIDI